VYSAHHPPSIALLNFLFDTAPHHAHLAPAQRGMDGMRRRIVPFALACVVFAVSLYLYASYIMWFGFWDGFASELDRAENTLATYFIWFSSAMGVWFVCLGFWRSHAKFNRRVLYSCLLFAFVTAVAVGLDVYFRSYMMDSAGG
jgi:hypothetical protein